MELIYFAFFMPLLPAIYALTKWPQMDQIHRWFGIMLWFVMLNSVAGRIWTMVYDGSNLPFFHVYILVEFLFLLQIFRLMFGKRVGKTRWLIVGAGFSLCWLINVLFVDGWWGFPDYIHALEAIIVLVIIVDWFLVMLREKIILHPYKTFEFWICAGLLIFFSGNFLLFAFSKMLLTTGKEVFEAIWKVNAILNILLYLIYMVALSWVKKTTR